MKRKGNLFEKICSFENILSCILESQKRKKIKRDILELNY
jgi:hypothetical protein